MINTENFDPSLLNTDKISFKCTDTVIYDIPYNTMRNIDNKNPYFIFNNVDGYIK